MTRTALVACAVVAGCAAPSEVAFQVDGYNNTLVARGSVLALWALAETPARTYKLGDGASVEDVFTISWKADPPPEALNPDGIGVATLILVPPLATVPDGETDPARIVTYGATLDGAVIYKAGDGGPPWAAALPLRFSCAACVRGTGGLDTFQLAPCANLVLEATDGPGCRWF